LIRAAKKRKQKKQAQEKKSLLLKMMPLRSINKFKNNNNNIEYATLPWLSFRWEIIRDQIIFMLSLVCLLVQAVGK
jgi:hypothetical protein